MEFFYVFGNFNLVIEITAQDAPVNAYYLLTLPAFSLVPWGVFGNLGSSFGRLWLIKERKIWDLNNVPPYLLGVIVGVILSDGSLEQKGSTKALLRIEQSFQHLPYLFFLFNILSPLCHNLPKLLKHSQKGKTTWSVRCTTRSLPMFLELRNLFYPNGVKRIPEGHIMFQLLSPIALAHWIMGDGESHHSGLRLCTNSYTYQDVVLLMNILRVRYSLDSTLHIKEGKYPMIYIRAESMPRLRNIVLPHMTPSMLYKIEVTNTII